MQSYLCTKIAITLIIFLNQALYPTSNKKAELSQRWPRDAPHIYEWPVPENFWESLSTPRGIFPQNFNGLFFRL